MKMFSVTLKWKKLEKLVFIVPLFLNLFICFLHNNSLILWHIRHSVWDRGDLLFADCPQFLFQCKKATPWGEDHQHLAEGPADETETERLREKTREVALLETHSAEHRRRGSSGSRPVGVLDVLPVKNSGSLKTDSYFAPVPGIRYFSE